MRQTHTVWGQGCAGAEAWAVGGTAGSSLAAAVAPLNAPAPSRPRSRLPFSWRRGRQGLAAGRVCSLPLPRWDGPAPLPAGAAGSRAGGGERERRAAAGLRGAARGGAGRRAPEGERAGGHGGFRASLGGGRLAGLAEPSRGLAGAGPGCRGRRRPGPPPAPPTLAQRAAAASPLRMSRKGPRAEVCADCSAPGKRGRAGGGTAHRGTAGRAPGPGGSALRGRRAGRGRAGGCGLRPPVSAPARATAEPRPWREGGLRGRCFLASVDRRGRTFPAPPPTPQYEGGGQLAAPPSISVSKRKRQPGVAGGLWQRPAGFRRWGRVWFCVISVPPPRLAPAARMVCAPAGVAEGKGQRAGQMGQGGLDTVSSGADDGVATPRAPCPGFPRLLAGPSVQGHHEPGHLPPRRPQAW